MSPEELPLTEELATTDSRKKQSSSKQTSWSPLSWFSRTEPVTTAQEKTGESPEKSIDLSQSDLTDSGNSVPETAPSLGTTEEIPFREDLLPSTVEEQTSPEPIEISPVEGLVSSAIGGEASMSVETDTTAQKWLSTVGIRFERKKDEPQQESFPADELTNSGLGERTIAVEQTGETPEVVSLVVPFDKEAAEALRASPSDPVESPFSNEHLAPIQKRNVERPDPDIAKAERHIESRVLRFPRANDSHEFQTDSVQAEQEVPMRLAASDLGSHSSVSVETESLGQRSEPQRSSAEKTVRPATNKNARSSKSGRHGKWSVQIRAYSREGHASSLVNKLQNSGFDAYVVRAKVSGRYWYRVRVGHFDSKRKAKATLASISENKTYSQAYVVVNR